MERVILFTRIFLKKLILIDENMIIPVNKAANKSLIKIDKLESNISGMAIIDVKNDKSNINDLTTDIFFSISYKKNPKLKYIE